MYFPCIVDHLPIYTRIKHQSGIAASYKPKILEHRPEPQQSSTLYSGNQYFISIFQKIPLCENFSVCDKIPLFSSLSNLQNFCTFITNKLYCPIHIVSLFFIRIITQKILNKIPQSPIFILMEELFSVVTTLSLLAQIFLCVMILLKHKKVNYKELLSFQGSPMKIGFLLFLGLVLFYNVKALGVPCIHNYTSTLLSISGFIWSIITLNNETTSPTISTYFVPCCSLLLLGSIFFLPYLQNIIIMLIHLVMHGVVVYRIFLIELSIGADNSKIQTSQSNLQHQTLTHTFISAFCASGEKDILCFVISIGMVEFFILSTLDIITKTLIDQDKLEKEGGLFTKSPAEELRAEPLEEEKDSTIGNSEPEKRFRKVVVQNEDISPSDPKTNNIVEETIQVEQDPKSGVPISSDVKITRMTNMNLEDEMKGHYSVEKDDTVLWKKIHFILALDCSGSMSGSRWTNLLGAYIEFIKQIQDMQENVITIFSFDQNNHLLCKEIPPKNSLAIANNLLFTGGGNSFDNNIQYCCSLITDVSASYKDYLSFILFFSDGEDSYPTTGIEKLKSMKDEGRRINLFTIACENGRDDVLKKMSATMGGDHYNISSSTALKQVFTKILSFK